MGEFDFFLKWRLTHQCNLMCPYCIRRLCDPVDSEKLKDEEAKLIKAAAQISEKIDELKFDNIKVELIGGEPTLFELTRLIDNFSAKKHITFHLTSNMSRPKEWYAELADKIKSKGYEMSITCSYHYLSQSLDSYFDKVDAIKSKVWHLMCEMPSLEENQEQVAEFYKRVQEKGLEYAIEADFREGKADVRKNIFVASSRAKNPRITVTYDDGTQQKYLTRNMMWSKDDAENIVEQKRIVLDGEYCDACYRTMYVDWHDGVIQAIQRDENRQDADCCRKWVLVRDWCPLSEPIPCHNYCSLCGLMSVSSKKEDLI